MKVQVLKAGFNPDQLVLSCEDCMRVHADFWKDKSLLEKIAICKNSCLHPEIKRNEVMFVNKAANKWKERVCSYMLAKRGVKK